MVRLLFFVSCRLRYRFSDASYSARGVPTRIPCHFSENRDNLSAFVTVWRDLCQLFFFCFYLGVPARLNPFRIQATRL